MPIETVYRGKISDLADHLYSLSMDAQESAEDIRLTKRERQFYEGKAHGLEQASSIAHSFVVVDDET